MRLLMLAGLLPFAVACGPAGSSRAPAPGGTVGDASGGDGAFSDPGDSSGSSDGVAAGDESDGMGPSTLCVPGTAACKDGDTKKVCSDTGQSWSETPCDSGTKCYDGQCSEVVCPPGHELGQCAGPTTYLACNDVGTHYVPHPCPDGRTCYEGVCVDYKCQPGALSCFGFGAIQQCKDDGSGWELVETCEKGGTCVNGSCVSACEVDLKAATYTGCEYYAVDLDNIEGGQFEPVAVVVSVPSAVEDAEVEITETKSGKKLTALDFGLPSMTVASGTLGIFKLPKDQDIDGTTKAMLSFHIKTSSPATLHQFNPLNGENVYTNDASLLLPSAAGGKEYYVMSWPMRDDAVGSLRGFVTIIASEPGQTQVLVTPRCAIRASDDGAVGSIPKGSTVGFVLAQGEVLNLETDGGEGSDLTGSHIVSSQRVSVFGGHECANVPLGINHCDHLEQQLVPVEAWGKRYVADAFKPRSKDQFDVFRIMAGGTDVLVETFPPQKGYEKFLLQAGAYVTFPTAGSFLVRATGRIMVGHFMVGSNYPGYLPDCPGDPKKQGDETGIGDPAFTLAVPTQQFLKEYTVLTPPGYEQNFINIIAPANAGVTVDGVPLSSPLKQVGSSGGAEEWGVAQHKVGAGVHTIEAKKKFGLTAYGYDCDVSYAYPGGLRLLSLSENEEEAP